MSGLDNQYSIFYSGKHVCLNLSINWIIKLLIYLDLLAVLRSLKGVSTFSKESADISFHLSFYIFLFSDFPTFVLALKFL